ncbi:MAG TPA: TonB-dependent receptor [Candidatus Angelobacter sp.]|nr:TonB-dependent receptor [Candidatus Angelobacter sp.]
MNKQFFRFGKLGIVLYCALLIAGLWAQTPETGELRLTVTDSAGLSVPGVVNLVSQANGYHQSFTADGEGHVTAKRLPYGVYRVEIQQAGFTPYSSLVEIRSALPRTLNITLGLATVETTVSVSADATLIDPHRTSSANRVGTEEIQNRRTSSPGRSVLDLVNAEPGWLVEANGILHPRESEYQVQYVMDGIPITDNRSPAFVPDFDVNDVQSMSVMTGGYAAEFGRKLGGVVEIVTARDKREGFHGKAVLGGGSFNTGDGFFQGQYGWGRNTLSLSLGASTTDRYLDAPDLNNFTNHGTNISPLAHFERDLTEKDRISVIFRREQTKFQVPNQLFQQEAGQLQDRQSFENSGQVSYTHIFSTDLLGEIDGSARNISAAISSNPFSVPQIVDQNRSYFEGYLKTAITGHSGANNWKTGVEGDYGSINEALLTQITDPTRVAAGTPTLFNFRGHAPDREGSAFAQDQVNLHNWTFSAGLRYDHYNLLVSQGAWSPRLGAGWYWPAANLLVHASYDRVFQTPAFENLLVASSPAVDSLSGQVLRLPVKPGTGNFYEFGITRGFWQKLRLDANIYRRDWKNFSDDDLLLNTGISFPIAFQSAVIQGEEIKISVPHWGPVSGAISYANSIGIGKFPISGGLFLGDDAASAISATSGRFPVSQDQRNTLSGRFQYQITPRIYAALGGNYGSGLPVEFQGSLQDAVNQNTAQQILNRVNFAAGRVRPSFSLDSAAGVILSKRDKQSVRLQADFLNMTDRLNLINFAGLFSGTAVRPPRSGNLRLQWEF